MAVVKQQCSNIAKKSFLNVVHAELVE